MDMEEIISPASAFMLSHPNSLQLFHLNVWIVWSLINNRAGSSLVTSCWLHVMWTYWITFECSIAAGWIGLDGMAEFEMKANVSVFVLYKKMVFIATVGIFYEHLTSFCLSPSNSWYPVGAFVCNWSSNPSRPWSPPASVPNARNVCHLQCYRRGNPCTWHCRCHPCSSRDIQRGCLSVRNDAFCGG